MAHGSLVIMAEILLVCGSPGLSQLFWPDEWSVLTRRSQFLLKVVVGNGFSCTQTIKTEMFPQSKISCKVLFLEGWNGHLVSKNYVFRKKNFCLPTVDWNSQRHFLFFPPHHSNFLLISIPLQRLCASFCVTDPCMLS